MARYIMVQKLCIVIFFLSACFLGLPLSPCFAVELSGKSAVLINGDTGQVLFEKDSNLKLYPASTTKILTALAVLNNVGPDETVTVSENVEGTDGTSIWLVGGEQLTVRELLYAMMLNSANDAALALAEYVGGSQEGFAKMMNGNAQKIGAQNSNFTNPHGLPDDNHYTTAYDLALIAKEAMKIPKFREIVATSDYTINRVDPEAQSLLYNHNRLLNRYEGANGIKTGYTVAAGQCIVASAIKNGRELIAVVLGSEGNNVWTDATGLLDYGFDNFNSVPVVENGCVVSSEVPVKHGLNDATAMALKSLYVDVPQGLTPEMEQQLYWEEVEAPVERGQVLGVMVVSNGQSEIGRVDLIAVEEVSRKSAANIWLWAAACIVLAVIILREYGRRKRIRRFIERQRYLRQRYQQY